MLSLDTQATLLLVGRLDGSSEAKPLTASEYNRLAKQLQELKLRPADLLRGLPDGLTVDAQRIKSLLGRGTTLALSLERWSQVGISVIGRSDPTYPTLLRKKLRGASAPLLFYAGKIELLETEAVSVVGSRDATPSGLLFASELGERCAKANLTVVSGDARGIDRAAMDGALEHGGEVIGVLVDSLRKATLAKRNRDAILSGRLLLICPYGADSRFTVPNAMDRNKYLYALASAAVVADSDVKGGTWSGAVENSRRKWSNGFVRDYDGSPRGNRKLLELGLRPIKNLERDLGSNIREFLFSDDASSVDQLDLLSTSNTTKQEPRTDDIGQSMFDLFAVKLVDVLTESPQTEATIAESLGIERSQAKAWLGKAEEKNLVTRLSRPVRYELVKSS